MARTILIVSATDAEAGIVESIEGLKPHNNCFRFHGLDISVLVTGVGTVMTAWKMQQWLSQNRLPSLAINIGIAGSFRDDLKTGDVVIPEADCFADMGVETDSGFITLFEAGLCDPEKEPFKNGWIHSDPLILSRIPKRYRQVRAITVNTVSGSAETISKYVIKYNPDIETMEGAAFFYICSVMRIPFFSLRSISNRITPGRREKWDISSALASLSYSLHELLLIPEMP
ncbi:MAG: futalosine hydrolase [Bacteroidales bacterium]|nr:futalosine hydrolase [Bacteroidales bacterium]